MMYLRVCNAAQLMQGDHALSNRRALSDHQISHPEVSPRLRSGSIPAPLALGTTPIAKRACARPPPADGHARWRATRVGVAPLCPTLAAPGDPAWSSSGCSRTGGLHPNCCASLGAPTAPAQIK